VAIAVMLLFVVLLVLTTILSIYVLFVFLEMPLMTYLYKYNNTCLYMGWYEADSQFNIQTTELCTVRTCDLIYVCNLQHTITHVRMQSPNTQLHNSQQTHPK